MSRVVPPVTKFAHAIRRISSSSNAARPSALLDSQARASRYLPRNLKDLRAECKRRKINSTGNKAEIVDRLAAYDIVGSQQFSTMGSGHRPTPRQTATISRTIHLMQGFKTSAPRQASGDSSTIDFFFFPEAPEEPPANPFKMRVPLLPDNYNPDRSPESGHAPESIDDAIPRPEISIVASHPEDVVPAAMSEVVGNDGLDVSIEQLTAPFSKAVKKIKEPGWLSIIWNDIIDDIFGPKGGSGKVAA